MFKEIIKKIEEFDTIIVHRHMRPDGDCIGSQAGLVQALRNTYPNKKIYSVGDDIPEYLGFIGLSDEVSDDIYKEALVIVVDTSIKERIYDDRWQNAAFLIKIDHHDDSHPFREENYLEFIDAGSAACSAIIARLIESSDVLKMNKEASLALYTGIITDTGRFLYRGVDKTLMNAAANLLSYDIDTEYMFAKLNLKEMNTYRLEAYVYKNMKMTKSGVVYMFFTKKIMKKFGVSCDEAAALVNTMASIKGSMIWVTFVDYGDNIRVRLRSRYVAVNEVARSYRGGGHLQASGATIYNKKEMKAILNDLDSLHASFKQANKELE
ncbi:MAG: bifunctional oligoribonuclease/PAP phosphatase NrnA [Bacilli bacterium]|nr:bifunctional oligoribonuclease/PAP phosphatase NrnA [Bacilli bacterium]